MSKPLLRIAISSCMMHPDPARAVFKGKRLLYVEESMFHWVARNRAIPLMLPTTVEELPLDDLLSGFDGLILSGGVDMAPESYGEKALRPEWAGDALRDEYEISLLKSAIEQDIPVLGICRGAQVINVGLGGTLYQDISFQKSGSLEHRNWDIYDQNFHQLKITPGGILEKIYGGVSEFRTNSVHHQGVKQLAPGLVVEAVSPDDGIIEGFYLNLKDQDRFVFGVQWHPEFQLPENKLIPADPLMHYFFDRCKKSKEKRKH